MCCNHIFWRKRWCFSSSSRIDSLINKNCSRLPFRSFLTVNISDRTQWFTSAATCELHMFSVGAGGGCHGNSPVRVWDLCWGVRDRPAAADKDGGGTIWVLGSASSCTICSRGAAAPAALHLCSQISLFCSCGAQKAKKKDTLTAQHPPPPLHSTDSHLSKVHHCGNRF